MRRIRMVVVLAGFALWALIIVGRLVWLQAIQHSAWQQRADRQQERTFAVAPQRGILYDRNLRELAMTVTVDSVYAVPAEMGEGTGPGLRRCWPRWCIRDPDDGFTERRHRCWRDSTTPSILRGWRGGWMRIRAIEQVQALNLKGDLFPERVQALLSEQRSGRAGAGLCGHGRHRTGRTGAGVRRRDARRSRAHADRGGRRRHVMGSGESEPLPGENLVLTIDANIQYMAERRWTSRWPR